MPMLHFRRNIDDITGVHLLSRFSPLLIISTSGSTEQNLSAFVMNMPVIPASWLKSAYIGVRTPLARTFSPAFTR